MKLKSLPCQEDTGSALSSMFHSLEVAFMVMERLGRSVHWESVTGDEGAGG